MKMCPQLSHLYCGSGPLRVIL